MNINNPQELLEFLSNIDFGYVDKEGNKHLGTSTPKSWYEEYTLQSPEQLKNSLCGNCYDQVEFERDWFIKNSYEVKSFFEMVQLDYQNSYPSHSFLVYKDNNKWCWFENADLINRGIHTFDTLEELLKYQYNKYLELLDSFNISKDEIEKIIIREFDKPESGISADAYLDYVINSKKVSI